MQCRRTSEFDVKFKQQMAPHDIVRADSSSVSGNAGALGHTELWPPDTQEAPIGPGTPGAQGLCPECPRGKDGTGTSSHFHSELE
ncbi:hypothetical protein EVAR_17281_1 [Eumeta japonica]|uniref:Uncharacterized protein n=1 Tax=Eumeta variegata TaxID=151549 RepID=A0A4C1TTM1_EUMVA|nr:hypothetical protein EVAR_17281_1 [Eumeta japonica]